MSELVLSIHRAALGNTDVGVIPFNFEAIPSKAYALLPRGIVDNKQEFSAVANTLGMEFPQILGYFQLQNEGKFFAYQRKGKEKGLFGQWSIGIGGHVSQEDLIAVYEKDYESYPPIAELIYEGAKREISEELGVEANVFGELDCIDEFVEATTHAIQSFANETSMRHIGIPMTLSLDEAFVDVNDLQLDPAEFCNYKWMTVEELKAAVADFEDWSQILINSMK